jgi:hypothetical protein
MQDHTPSRPLSESAWQRGLVDFKRLIGSVWFWLLEVLGGGAISAFDPLTGIAFMVTLVLLSWMVTTITAPIRQRDEARAAIGQTPNSERLAQFIADGRALQHRIVRTSEELVMWLSAYDHWVTETAAFVEVRWGIAERELFHTVENLQAAKIANAFDGQHNLKKLILDRRLQNLRELIQRRRA